MDRRKSEYSLDTAKIATIVGHSGEQTGSVYKITVGRDDLAVKEMGATINARMRLNTWAAFLGTKDDAVIAGDVAMLESEVTPVLKSLRKNGLDVVAIHHHMTAVRPMVIFFALLGKRAGGEVSLDLPGSSGPARQEPAWGHEASLGNICLRS